MNRYVSPEPPGLCVGEAVGLTADRHTLVAPHDFTWQSPSVVAVVGPNGAGKTTLIRLIGGLATPTSGHLELNGESPRSRARRHLIAYSPDRPITYPDMTVERQCAYVARMHGLGGLPHWFDDLRHALGVTDRLLERPPVAFSKGETQKASLLLALSRPHRMLLLDEPLSGLDVASQDAFVEWLIGHSHDEHLLTIVATHEQPLIDAADEVFQIERADQAAGSDPSTG